MKSCVAQFFTVLSSANCSLTLDKISVVCTLLICRFLQTALSSTKLFIYPQL